MKLIPAIIICIALGFVFMTAGCALDPIAGSPDPLDVPGESWGDNPYSPITERTSWRAWEDARRRAGIFNVE